MRVKIEQLRKANNPNEVVVSLQTTDGNELLVVHSRSIEDNTLDVGYPINTREKDYLVELPRETENGSWRVWVPQELVL